MAKKLVNYVKIKVEHGANVIPDGMENMNQYTVTLKFKGRQLTTPFFTGLGWDTEPNQLDVLSSLLSDASCYENSSSFEDFCSDLGYNSDSRKAEKIYQACEKNAKKLKQFLGDDHEAISNELSNY
jgi:hypothetical protein